MAEATRLVDICLEAGVNMFDTADIYSNGLSEEVLGKAIAGRRQLTIVATKASFRVGPGANDVGTSRHHLLNACEASLRRLGTDYIDLYQMHGFDALTPVEETLSTLDDARPERQGALHRLLEFLRLASDEIAVGIRATRLVALHRASGVLLAHRPRLRMGADAAGARSGRRHARVESARLGTADRQDPAQPGTSRRSAGCRRRPRIGPQVADEHLYRVVDALDEVAKETGKTVPQIAFNWLTTRPTVASVIVGARNEKQLRENLGAVGWTLTPDQMARLDAASATTIPYPYWHQRQAAPDRNPSPQ